MPETRSQRIERLENTRNRTERQEQILASDHAYQESVARLGDLVATWRAQED